MKLLTFLPPRARSGHFGVLMSNNRVLDLNATPGAPKTTLRCVQQGPAGLDKVRAALATAEAAARRGQSANTYALGEIRFLPPITPGKIMAIGRNYGAHVAEVGHAHAPTRPGGFVKLVNCLNAHQQPVYNPSWNNTLDYENELAVILAVDCVDIPAERWENYVFGYTIMNDVSAREVQLAEGKEGNIVIGKNFPTSAPLGPWIVTKDEIKDPHALRITTRVNGEVRQDSNTSDQIHKIPQQMAWYSRAGWQAGDVLSTGTPSGVALGYKGPGSWYMKAGDVVECEIEKIGVLRNVIRDRRD